MLTCSVQTQWFQASPLGKTSYYAGYDLNTRDRQRLRTMLCGVDDSPACGAMLQWMEGHALNEVTG